jgi:hypothetical protein
MKSILKYGSYVAVFVLGAVAALAWHLHTDTKRYYFVQYYSENINLPAVTEKVDREACERLRASVVAFLESRQPPVCVPQDHGELMRLLFAEQDRLRAVQKGK